MTIDWVDIAITILTSGLFKEYKEWKEIMIK